MSDALGGIPKIAAVSCWVLVGPKQVRRVGPREIRWRSFTFWIQQQLLKTDKLLMTQQLKYSLLRSGLLIEILRKIINKLKISL